MLRFRTLFLLVVSCVYFAATAAAQDGMLEADYERLPAPGLMDVAPGSDTIVVEPEPFTGSQELLSPAAAGKTSPAPNVIWGLPNPFAGDSFLGPFEGETYCPPSAYPGYEPPWSAQFVPDGLIYRSYLAGPREPRMAAIWNYSISESRWVLDGTLGGRVGLFRYGNDDPLHPQGIQLDAEGAAFPRIDLQSESWDLETADFRWGLPLTYGRGPWEYKLAYYHLSSHLGDEYMINNNVFTRINYVRDAAVLGVAYRYRDALRIYGEAGYAFHADGGAKPWEFQFGAEYSQLAPTGLRGSPFFAINGYLRQELNYGGNLTAQAGWQWRGYGSGHLLRAGVQYMIGPSVAFEFYRKYEKLIGLGVWYDY